jgi:excinuclease ABC subunit A
MELAKLVRFGLRKEVDPDLVLASSNLTIAEGAIRVWTNMRDDSWNLKKVAAVGDKYGFTIHEPWKNISEENKNIIMYGTDKEKFFHRYGKWPRLGFYL